MFEIYFLKCNLYENTLLFYVNAVEVRLQVSQLAQTPKFSMTHVTYVSVAHRNGTRSKPICLCALDLVEPFLLVTLATMYSSCDSY